MKNDAVNKTKTREKIRLFFHLILVAWTALMIGMSYISYLVIYDNALISAKSTAVNNYRTDIAYRKWAATQGGVYVPSTDLTPPNPYLSSIPERDIETGSGRKLTLVNPEYMTRLVHELGFKEFGIQRNIASLNPIRPEDAPDAWERRALLSFRNGTIETSSLEMIGNDKYFRYMAPVMIDPSCLKCHADQGYQVGELGGGISVSVPWKEFETSINYWTKNILGMYGLIWLLGLVANLGARRLVTSQINRQEDALEALAQSERMLNTVLQATSVGIGLIKDRVVQWTNDAMGPLTGFSPDELFGRPSREFYASDHEYERAGALTYSEITVKSKSTVETRFLRKDGTIVEVLMNLSAVDRDDLSAGAVFVLMDISESKKMSRRLEENVLRMERAEEAAKFGNWELDLQDNMVRLSPSASRIEGSHRLEIPLSELNQLLLPEYVLPMNLALEDLILYQKPYEVEFKFLRQSDKQAIHVRSIAGIDAESGKVWGVIQDVTSQKKTEEALIKSEAKYRMLAENMTDVIWSSDTNLGVTYLSPSIKTLLGYEPEELFGKTIFDMTTPELKEKFQPVIQERIQFVREHKTLTGISYDFEVTRKDGSTVWIELISSPSIDSNGDWVGFQGVARDTTQRKNAEEALRESENRFRSYVESSPIGIFEADSTGRVVSANRALTTISGYTTDELLQMNIMEKIATQHVGKCLEAFETLKTSGMASVESEVISSHGDMIWMTLSGVKLSERRYLLFGQDISERKKAEEVLAERELLYRTLFEGARESIMIMDMEKEGIGRIVSANPVAAEIHGYSLDEFTTLSLQDLETPDSAEGLQLRIDTVMSGQLLRGEVNHRRKDGSIFPVEISANLIEIRGHRYCIGIDRDISERKAAEKALYESENRFRSYVESSPIGIFETDGEGRISSANLAQAGITGYTVDEILKLNIMDVVVPEYLDMCLEIFEKLKATGGPESVEIESIRANGQKMWELVTGVKLSSNRFLFFAQDVTDRKQAQEELLEMERKFLQSQKLESLGVLAGGIAHDFNNLLAVIIGNIELAQESDFSSSDRNLFLKTALSASMKSAGLVRQMLDYSGKGAFEFSELNLSELVENNIDMFRMTVPKNINLKVDRSSDNIFVKADVSQIQQVIMNLLINASEAIDGNNGAIEITTGAKYCNESILSENLLPEKPQPQDMAFILVRDDGVGMDAETVERIFDPFFSTKFVGRGLGMSVVHGVVRGHHGAVTVDSRPGAGTTVTVYLPLLHRTGSIDKSPTNDETDNISTREKASEARKFSVLVVDDEQIVLELVLTQLQHLGCKTFSAMDGKQAIDVFMKNPLINLVILDLVMPEMGGVEAFHRLMELNPELKIVMCSGYKEEHFKDEFKTGLQPIAFLDKPYRFSTLKTIIERLKNDPCSERPV